MQQSKSIEQALTYAKTLINIPYRWYDESADVFKQDDQFWCGDGPAPSAKTIILEDKCIVCTGLINLMRRYIGLPIPQYGEYSGGTVAWVKYLTETKRIKDINLDVKYPAGTLLIKKYKNHEEQGHVAVMLEDSHIIHAAADIPYADRHRHKNHGYVRIEKYDLSYFTHACDAIEWLVM